MLDATEVVAISAGLSRPGAAIEVNRTDRIGESAPGAEPTPLAQPDSSEAADTVPRGSNGAAIHFNAWRREDLCIYRSGLEEVGDHGLVPSIRDHGKRGALFRRERSSLSQLPNPCHRRRTGVCEEQLVNGLMIQAALTH